MRPSYVIYVLCIYIINYFLKQISMLYDTAMTALLVAVCVVDVLVISFVFRGIHSFCCFGLLKTACRPKPDKLQRFPA